MLRSIFRHGIRSLFRRSSPSSPPQVGKLLYYDTPLMHDTDMEKYNA